MYSLGAICNLYVEVRPYLTLTLVQSLTSSSTDELELISFNNGAPKALAVSRGLIETFRPSSQYPWKVGSVTAMASKVMTAANKN